MLLPILFLWDEACVIYSVFVYIFCSILAPLLHTLLAKLDVTPFHMPQALPPNYIWFYSVSFPS